MISYAQNAEDVRLRRAFGDQPTGFYVDVGAYDPESCSLTKHFYDRGWRGINIEPCPPSFERIAAARTRDINLPVGASNERGSLIFHQFDSERLGLNTFCAEVAEKHRLAGFPYSMRRIEVYRLAELLAEHGAPVIDFLNIDVEGYERRVLDGAELERFRPRVLVIESTVPLSSAQSHQGWQELVLAAGYRFAALDGVNRFYVRDEDAALAEPLAVPPSTLDDFVPYRYQRAIAELETELLALRQMKRRWLVRGAAEVDRRLRRAADRIAEGWNAIAGR